MKRKPIVISFSLIFALMILTSLQSHEHQLYGLSTENLDSMALENPYSETANVYKGQLHGHTTNSDGTQSPLKVVEAYKKANYDFMVITDHDYVTHDPMVQDMLFISGTEVTSTLGHITTINVPSTPPLADAQEVIDWTRTQGGLVWLAHPNLTPSQMTERLIKKMGYNGIEVYNYAANSYAEEKWDYILTELDRKITAIAVDDCHNIKNRNHFNGGWVMVFADSLTESEILDNLEKGNFYSTQGPIINAIEANGIVISIKLQQRSKITWIGASGSILQERTGVWEDSYSVLGNEEYIRIRVESSGYAWTNPIYVNKLVVDTASVSDSRVNPSQLITISGQVHYDGITIPPASGSTVQAYVDLDGKKKASSFIEADGAFNFPPFPAEKTVGLYYYNVYTIWGGQVSNRNQTVPVIVDSLKVSNYTTNLPKDQVEFHILYAYDDEIVQEGKVTYSGLVASTNTTGWATFNLSSLRTVNWGSTAQISDLKYDLNSEIQNQTVAYTKNRIANFTIKANNPITNVEWNFFTSKLSFDGSDSIVVCVGDLGNPTHIEVDGTTFAEWSYDSTTQQVIIQNVNGRVILSWSLFKVELWIVGTFSIGLTITTGAIFYKRRKWGQ